MKDTFKEYLKNILRKIKAIQNNVSLADERSLPGGVFFLDDNEILALPRDDGDSRYLYGRDGFNFWAYASGYMHCNEGLFSVFLRAAEGQEPPIAFFAGIPRDPVTADAVVVAPVAAGFSLRSRVRRLKPAATTCAEKPAATTCAEKPAATAERYTPVPILQVPVMSDAHGEEFRRYTVLSPTSACYITESKSLRFALRVFVTEKKEICFSLNAANLSGSKQKIFLSTFLNPFLRHQIYESGEDRWFKEIKVVKPSNKRELGAFLVTVNEDKDHRTSARHYGVVRRMVSFSCGGHSTVAAGFSLRNLRTLKGAATTACEFTQAEACGYKGSHISRLLCHEETTSRYQYVGGSRGSLHAPASLERGTFGDGKKVCAFTEVAVVGDMLHMELAKGGEARVDVVFSFTDDKAKLRSLLGRKIGPKQLDKELSVLNEADEERHAGLAARIAFGKGACCTSSICHREPTVGGRGDPVKSISCTGLLRSGAPRNDIKGDLCNGLKFDRSKPALFNSFFEHLKRQVEFCALLKGYAQLSENSLIGVRDVFQAIEALVYWEPEAGRRKMLEALEYMTPEGRSFRQYSLPSGAGDVGRMDLRPFIDQGTWVISCVSTYMKLTGDAAFLREVCGYHEIIDEEKKRVRRASKRGSVLEHLTKIMDHLLAHRDMKRTGCVRAMYGDWNDALDGLGISSDPSKPYGTGVSVMATLQVYQNALEMAELLRCVDGSKCRSKIKAYEKAAAGLEKALKKFAVIKNGRGEKRILHGWGDKRKYMVGSFKDPDGRARDALTSNAFWVISGMYEHDTAMRSTLLAAFKRLDSKYGLKTFEPFFPEDTKGVGRIVNLPPGTAENAATYVHATLFGIVALFKMGRPREAWEQILKVLPFTDIHKTFSHSPFVMPNSYGYNEEKGIDGESMNDWQTGSSNVILKLFIRYVFGFEAQMDGVWIQPASWMPFDSFEFKITVRGREVHIQYKRRSLAHNSVRNMLHNSVCIPVAAGFSLRSTPVVAPFSARCGSVSGGRVRNLRRLKPAATELCSRTFIVNGVEMQGTRDHVMNTVKLWLPWKTLVHASTEIMVKDFQTEEKNVR